MAKTLDEAGVKRLIQEIKGANKNLNATIPISTENTTESMAQNVKNIADYVEKAKAAGVADVNGMAVTCLINDENQALENSGIGYLYGDDMICGILVYNDNSAFIFNVISGNYTKYSIIIEGSSNVVDSSMLIKGARRPIILTPSTTEVDEETYQKLLSDDVDVVYNTINMTTKDIDSDKNITMTFSYAICAADIMQIASIDIQISSTSPHSVVKGDPVEQNISPKQVVNKSTLSPVLQEIDLTGTDADRKAKLDQFETDWKALTGASDLTGARFVGKFGITDDVERNITGIMTYCAGDTATEANDNHFYGICNGYSFSEQKSQIAVKVSCKDGSLTITPLFSHLEAITIKAGNTPEDKADNKAAIETYRNNLTALGVDVTKGYMIPAKIASEALDGFVSYHSDTADYPWSGVFIRPGGSGKFVSINKDGFVVLIPDILISGNIYKTLTTTSKGIIPAINEVNANAVHSDKLVPTLEAITIKTDNSTESKAANVAAIKAYVDNLKALGVDVTKGYMIPFGRYNSIAYGILVGSGENPRLQGYMNSDYTTEAIFISPDGTVNEISLQSRLDAGLKTNSKIIVKAINEVNALAKSKQDALTSGTNIKTVNGQSLLGSGDIAISAAGGSAPALVDIDDISGSAGDSVPVDVFNKIANAASAKTPIFGYSKLVNGTKNTYEIIPLYVKNVSTSDTNGSLSIQFIAENAYNSVGIMKRSDTECIILVISSRPFALDTSVDKSSTRGIQSSAVWNEIHSEPMTVNTATSGVTTLSSTDKHKILCYADSGTQQYNLPSSPVDGETFLFLKVKSGHEITIQSGTGNQNIYDCSSGNSVVSKTIATSTKSKITVTYSSTVDKWLLMTNDFLS